MIKKIAREIKRYGGETYFVGGCVRDDILGKAQKDIDVEVYNIEPGKLIDILSGVGEVDIFGKSFGILKVKGLDVDFSMPRKERATGSKHTDFEVTIDPYLSIKEASRRRDFTMNAILQDVLTKEVTDPFNGVRDIRDKTIRHIDDKTFQEDPLRAYRAVQFAGRLGFNISPETISLCRDMDLSHLPRERIFKEILKLLLESDSPSIGFEYMKQMSILEKYFPLLAELEKTHQSPKHHPEGNVWNHTMLVIDEAARIKHKSDYPDSFMIAALLHDIGKPSTTEERDGAIIAHGHAKVGANLSIDFLEELTDNKRILSQVESLVKNHMRPMALSRSDARNSAYRKFAASCNAKEVLLLFEADFKGRGGSQDYDKEFEEANSFLEAKFKKLSIKKEEKIKPLIMGRDLIKLGLTPGKDFGEILNNAFDMQLEGYSKEEILEKITLL